MADRRPWTDVDRQTLRYLIEDCGLSLSKVAESLGRSYFSVKGQAYLLNIKTGQPYVNNHEEAWLECEDEYLRQWYGKVPREVIAKKLGRSVNSLTNRRRKLGLPPSTRRAA